VLAVQRIESAKDLQEFENEWRRFLARIPSPTPFQSPEWLSTWWGHFGSGQLRTLVFRDGAAVVGVLPCFLHAWNGKRQLTLLGTGVSDYLDPVFDPLHVPEIIESLRAELRRCTDWDLCDWQDLSAGSPLEQVGVTSPDTPCSSVHLDGTYEAFLTERPKDLRRNLRRYKQRALAEGPVCFEVSERPEPEWMDALIELHAARWARLGDPGVFETNRSAAFTREAAQQLAEHGAIRMFAVRFMGRVAAILLALRNETTIFGYVSAFDPQHEALGFGRELLAQAFRYAYHHAYREWNFLRGEEAYKFSWGATVSPKRRVRIDR
jgi:CelD/BcsL family acetyltransferase involved in cellulose biosynthesis